MSHQNLSQLWDCQLTVMPTRVIEGETFELAVSLSHPSAFDDFTGDNYADFFDQLTFTFSADHPKLVAGRTEPRLEPKDNSYFWVWTSASVPKLADGTYGIEVVVTTKKKAGGAGQYPLEPFPEDGVRGSTIIHVANHYAETRADVSLQRSSNLPTSDEGLWVAIRNRSAAIEFERYHKFVNNVFSETPKLCKIVDQSASLVTKGKRDRNIETEFVDFVDVIRTSPVINIFGPYAYGVLKLATQAFLMLESGVVIKDSPYGRNSLLSAGMLEKERIRLGEPIASFTELQNRLSQYLAQSEQNAALPYLNRILANLVTLDIDQGGVNEVLPYFNGVLQHRLTSPSLIELIWSYWHEEGMLVQTMNTVALRFQNRRSSPHDPLGELELDPLRPLNNLMWGFIQDEHNRLTVPRRAYEYQHHYGLSLVGKAVSAMIPADVRSKFIESFHNLLYRTAVFYRDDSDTTVIADAFPLLNALKEVHLLLAEGAHNQFGDLPWTARGEMLMMQWMLARPEMREFLRGRYMVPYQEQWMGAVDSMKRLQGWTDTTVTHFHELAVTGERILLSIRYGDWIDIENTQEQAKNWARYWKPEIQRYIHGYMTATGVDLMADITDTRDAAVRLIQPSALLQRRLQAQTVQTNAQRPQSIPRLTRQTPSGLGSYPELPIQTPSRILRYKKDE